MNIQDFFSDGATQIDIPPGEYEGPLIIRHSCVVDGHGATLWAKKRSALVIDSKNVTIKNMRVEIVGVSTNAPKTRPDEFVAIESLWENIVLDNVEVYGDIRELVASSSSPVVNSWNLPRVIDLGYFAANERNEFSIELDIPEPVLESVRIINSVYGLKIEPQMLSPGKNDLRFVVEPMRDGTILYGDLLLEIKPVQPVNSFNKILRRIYISGRAQKGASIRRVIEQVSRADINSVALPTTPISKQKISQSKSAQIPANKIIQNPTATITAKKGQRVPVPNVEELHVSFDSKDLPEGIEIDAYAFCLGANKKVSKTDDIIFLNNPRHESYGVYLDSKRNTSSVGLSFKEIPAEIQSVVICFTIYDEGNRNENNFSSIIDPKIILSSAENIYYEFPLKLNDEKAFTALECYRNKGTWKINFIGAGFKDGLKKLCEFYGSQII